MKKSIIKKIFIKISKFLGYEIIDQNELYYPTLNKELNENLSSISKSIILPMGEVNLTRKVKSLLILFRTNTNVEIWDQNRKRIFENPKIEYVLRSLFSLIKSIKKLNKQNKDIQVILKVVDDNSNEENLKKIKNLLDQNKQANFVRMTGSGSAIIMYFNSNKFAKNALKIYKRKLNNCLCIITKII